MEAKWQMQSLWAPPKPFFETWPQSNGDGDEPGSAPLEARARRGFLKRLVLRFIKVEPIFYAIF